MTLKSTSAVVLDFLLAGTLVKLDFLRLQKEEKRNKQSTSIKMKIRITSIEVYDIASKESNGISLTWM